MARVVLALAIMEIRVRVWYGFRERKRSRRAGWGSSGRTPWAAEARAAGGHVLSRVRRDGQSIHSDLRLVFPPWRVIPAPRSDAGGHPCVGFQLRTVARSNITQVGPGTGVVEMHDLTPCEPWK